MNDHSHISPPRIPLRFLRLFCDPRLLEDVEGDLTELYEARTKNHPTKAKWLFIWDVLLLFRPGIIRNFTTDNHLNNYTMLRNHLKTALRHASKYKGYTTINLLGLVVGIASSILILLWIKDEVSMDQFHAKSDRIYQVWRNIYQASGEIVTVNWIPQPLEEVLENEYPEVDQVTLLSWEAELLFRNEDKAFYETGRYASPEFFSIFSFPFLAGDPNTALDDLHAVVISESLANKYFGEDGKSKALGQTFTIDEQDEFMVTGVFKDPGPNSSIDFDWILPAQEYIQRNTWVEGWYSGGFRIYFSLRENADIETVRQRVLHEINENTDYAADERIYLQKFSENYLHSTFENGIPVGGRIQYVRIMGVIAIFILVIACINFMNLATARSSRRAKEIGLRKVLGAQKGSLRQQFFTESFLLSVVSVLVALLIVFLAIPYFNNITGKSLALDMGDPQLWLGLAVITVITGLLSGSYPALLLPSFKTVHSLKGVFKHSKSDTFFRNGLVVFQFALSILLIIGTLVVSQQMKYILNKNLGLDKENLVFVNMQGDLFRRHDVYKAELLKIPEVKNVTFTSGNPISYGRSTGSANWEGKNPDDVVEINVLHVDTDFFETMGMEIIAGRGFSKELATDSSNYVINEVTADIMGFEDPVEQKLSVWGIEGRVIGVVRNFHMDNMYKPIAPLIIRYDPNSTLTVLSVAFIRVQHNIQNALQGIEQVTNALNPAYPFRYEFLDKEYEQSYRSEATISTLVNIFALVSVFISCLGLLGLSSFSADQRAKEIGIRKVHGASVLNLVMMLSGDYARLMVWAFILAAPVAYYYTQQWLNNFAFHIDLNFTIFIVSGVLAFIIGALTVSFKSYQAAIVNPVKTLKDE